MSEIRLILFIGFLSFPILAQQSDFSSINFNKADAVANKYKRESLVSLPILSYNLTNTLTTDVEKFRAIYRWVCANIENDYYAYVKNKNARKRFAKDSLKLVIWNEDFTRKTFKKLLNEQKTLCTGYAYLIKELANLADIECEIINGYGRTTDANIGKLSIPNHSWNAVQLNNKWYLCDATWSSGIYDLSNHSFEFDYNDGYFLTHPNLFVKDHYPLNVQWLLTEKEISITDFLNEPIVYNSTHKNGVIPIEPKKLELEVLLNQEVVFCIKESTPLSIMDLQAETVSGTYKKTSNIVVTRIENNLLEIKCSFKQRGTYDFHLKLNDDYLATYIVKVKK